MPDFRADYTRGNTAICIAGSDAHPGPHLDAHSHRHAGDAAPHTDGYRNAAPHGNHHAYAGVRRRLAALFSQNRTPARRDSFHQRASGAVCAGIGHPEKQRHAPVGRRRRWATQ